MKSFLITILFIFFLTFCRSNINNQSVGQINNVAMEKSEDRTTNTVNGSIGIITTSDKYKFGDSIFVFNEQKRPFTSIVITYEYQVMTLRCLMITKDFYKVQIRDSVIGYLPKENPLIKYQTWEEHILSVFSVGFDEKANPLRKLPSKEANTINYNPDEFYLPYKINGDWLQVRWGSEGDWDYGWIIWRKDGILLIELFYFA